jgi:hypothetical protein
MNENNLVEMILTANNTVMNLPFAPVRICKSGTILLNGNTGKIFPLFGPFCERAWAEGWEPELLYGFEDEIKEKTIFRTRGVNADEPFFLWVISKFESDKLCIEYTVHANERLWFIMVECKPHQALTLATITYTYIGLSLEGHHRNQLAFEKMFHQNLTDWEDAINHYIRTGKKLLTNSN